MNFSTLFAIVSSVVSLLSLVYVVITNQRMRKEQAKIKARVRVTNSNQSLIETSRVMTNAK